MASKSDVTPLESFPLCIFFQTWTVYIVLERAILPADRVTYTLGQVFHGEKRSLVTEQKVINGIHPSVLSASSPQTPRWRPIHFSEVTHPAHSPKKCLTLVLMDPKIYLANHNDPGECHLQTRQSERAETQQHVRLCDVTMGINLFLGIFQLLSFFWNN